MKYFAGIDLGTSSTKVLIMREDGASMGTGGCGYDVYIPQSGYAEQDPEQWWDAVKQALTAAVRQAGIEAKQISGIGFSGQMHGMVALGKDGRPVCPAVIHLDGRSGDELKEIRQLAGTLQAEQLLNTPSAGMMISTVYWLKKHAPQVYDQIHTVLSPKDYIRYRLCGEIGTESTDAGAALAYSVKERRWCTELFDRLDIRRDIWAPVHESCEQAGGVTKEAADETGLKEGTVLVYGAGDSLAALTGNAIVEPGVMTCNIGTSSQLAVVVDQPVFDHDMRIQTWCHTVPNRWVVQGGTLNGGSTLSWLRREILKDSRPFAELDQEAGSVPAGAEGLFFIPYLVGERTPYNDPKARGVYFGLGMNHTRAHIIRATMEGVLFNLNECIGILDEMHVAKEKLIASGGAARGKQWKDIQANMLDMPVYTTKVEEEACQGAAILAAVGMGCYKDIPEACRATVALSDEVTEPDPEKVKIYREKQAVFHDLYQSVKDLYPRLC